MKILASGISCLTVLFVVLFSAITPNTGLSQDDRIFFSTSGDTVLHYYEYFNPDTKLWIARFNIYGGIGSLSAIISEAYSMTKPERIHNRLAALQNQYQLSQQGVTIERTAIPNLSVELEAKKKQKIALPEGMYTRRYEASYTIKLGNETILSSAADQFLIGKQNRVEEIVESDGLEITCWKHPTSPRYFSTYSINHQKLIIPTYRYSYVENLVKDYLVYTF